MRPLPARLQPVDRPFVHLVAHRRFGEEDAPVVGDVEIVGQAQPAVVVDRAQAAVGLVGRLLDLAVGRDAIEAHAADADIEIVGPVERHAERLAADMGEDLHLFVVGREEAHDVAMARPGIEIVVSIEDDVLRRLDPPQPDQADAGQPVVLHEGRVAADADRLEPRHLVEGRADIDLGDDAVAVLQPADVDASRRPEGCRPAPCG